MDLYLNNKPTKVYVPPTDPKKVFELSQTMIANDALNLTYLLAEALFN